MLTAHTIRNCNRKNTFQTILSSANSSLWKGLCLVAEKLTAGGEAAKYERPLSLLLAYTTHEPSHLMENFGAQQEQIQKHFNMSTKTSQACPNMFPTNRPKTSPKPSTMAGVEPGKSTSNKNRAFETILGLKMTTFCLQHDP